MSRLNHAKLAHRGRPTESASTSRRRRDDMRFTPARAASAGRSLSPAEIAAYAQRLGFPLGAR